MKKELINKAGLLGIVSLLSYTAAVLFAPGDYPGYDWISQAVSDLSADSAPSRILWERLAAFYDSCSVVCVTAVTIYVCDRKISTKLFRSGMYLFTAMTWISKVGYTMFPLTDAGKDIDTLSDKMHMAVTAAVVGLSIVSLTLLAISGFKKKGFKGIGVTAAIALALMFTGAIGFGAAPKEYFGLFERLSVFSPVAFTAILGIYLFSGFGETE